MAGSAIAFARDERDAYLDTLCELVSIPSVSTDPERNEDVRRAAEWLQEWIVNEGGASELLETDGHPLVWGEFRAGSGAGRADGGEPDGASPDAPTILLYGHYDVQPADPLDLWETDPFSPAVRGERLYGRGASDMKAQVMAMLFAVRSILQTSVLPATIRVLFEGEEEVGSPSLAGALKDHGDRFKADICLNPDTGMIGVDSPSIRYGLRGLAYFELWISGPERDLHSGAFGGVVHNPAQALAEVVSGMHDSEGRITLPGFYDRVREIDSAERNRLAQVPFDDSAVKKLSGVPEPWGETEFTANERVSARPTLEINGIQGGYTGPGAKTVIPAQAMAKISMRLVPDQRSEDIRGQLESYLADAVPASVKWELKELAGGAPFFCDPASPAHTALAQALEHVWAKKPILSRSGGSVPVASELHELLGVPSVLTGFGLPDDRIHSPNESQHLPTWYRGIEAIIRFIHNYGRS